MSLKENCKELQTPNIILHGAESGLNFLKMLIIIVTPVFSPKVLKICFAAFCFFAELLSFISHNAELLGGRLSYHQ